LYKPARIVIDAPKDHIRSGRLAASPTGPEKNVISYHAALIYSVVLAAAADGDLTDPELDTIREMVIGLPIFKDFETGKFSEIAGACTDLLTEEDGLDAATAIIRQSLPRRLCATAYALACDVIAVDGIATQEELRFLEMLRHEIEVDRLTAAAIERGSAARYARHMEE
jgi:tellurite resistance protein